MSVLLCFCRLVVGGIRPCLVHDVHDFSLVLCEFALEAHIRELGLIDTISVAEEHHDARNVLEFLNASGEPSGAILITSLDQVELLRRRDVCKIAEIDVFSIHPDFADRGGFLTTGHHTEGLDFDLGRERYEEKQLTIVIRTRQLLGRVFA